MKKILGLTYGGLQKKIVHLVMGILIITIAIFALMSVFQRNMLTGVVQETKTEQEQAISDISEKTMENVISKSMLQSTSLHASIVNSDFSDVVHTISMIQSMAQSMWNNRENLKPVTVPPPDPANDGTLTAMALAEEGVDPSLSEYMGVMGHLCRPLVSIVEHSDIITNCYLGLVDGTFLDVDGVSSDKLDENGKPLPFPVRDRPWYKLALEEGGIAFTDIDLDTFNHRPVITCSVPLVSDGELIGVAGADITLDNLHRLIEESNIGSGFVFVVNDSGDVVLAPSNNSLFSSEAALGAQELSNKRYEELSSFIEKSLAGKTDVTLLDINEKKFYLTGAPLPTLGWALITVVSKDSTEVPEQMLLENYNRINQTAREKFFSGARQILILNILIILILAVIGFFASMNVSKRITRPIEEMTRDIHTSSADGNLFVMKDAYRTDDEIEILAKAFDDLSKKTRQYIRDITRITKEKERVSTELQMASRIQNSALPSVDSPFPGREEFSIYATMEPAREIGGDFYDFLLIDPDHLYLVIADVSGKGIPAALVMMKSKIILQSYAMLGKEPAEILEKTNDALCCDNSELDMFVTVWAGILEISSGILTAANAGHEYPAIMRNERFALLKDPHGFIVGGLENISYKQYQIRLMPGDKLFLYTDGIPEATDSHEQMFGNERMVRALNKNPQADPKQILENMHEAVDDFVLGAEQFDDMTMLCLEYKGSSKKEKKE